MLDQDVGKPSGDNGADSGRLPIKDAPNTLWWWHQWGKHTSPVFAWIGEEPRPLPYFTVNAPGGGLDAFSALVQATVLDRRRAILDWGTGDSLSAYETSQALGDTTVFSIDPKQMPLLFDARDERYQGALLPPAANGSMVVYFSINGYDIDPRTIGGRKFDAVHIFAPTPSEIAIQTIRASHMGRRVVVVVDPLYGSPHLGDELKKFPKDLLGRTWVLPLTPEEITTITGASHSRYLRRMHPENDRFETILVDY